MPCRITYRYAVYVIEIPTKVCIFSLTKSIDFIKVKFLNFDQDLILIGLSSIILVSANLDVYSYFWFFPKLCKLRSTTKWIYDKAE